MGGQQAFTNGQPGSNPPQQGPQGNNFQFTQQDQQHIQRIAQSMVSNMTPQGRMQLQQTAMSLPPQLKQSLAEKGTDLAQYVIKQKATQTFLQQRSRMTAQGGNQGAFAGAGGTPQNASIPQPPNSMQVQQTPTFDQAGNMDHILRQQRDALHHQQEGQVVVPANTGQGQRASNAQRAPSRVQKTPQQNQTSAFSANRSTQAPNQTPQPSQPNWSNMQNATPNIQQTPQMPQGHNFSHVTGQNPQQNQMQGQTNGLNNALRTPQQNRGMPTLNQPMNPPNQSQNTASPNPVQQTPKQGQRPTQNTLNGTQRSLANGQQHPTPTANMQQKPVLPPAMQQHLATLKTDEEKKNFLIMMRQKQQQARQQAANSNLTAMAQGVQGRGQAPQSGPNAQIGFNANTPTTGAQPISSSTLSQPSNVRTNQGSQQPESQNRQPPFMLTDLQEQQMDNVGYPDNILNNSSVLAQMPGNVKNWGQLKAWVARNAQNLPPDSLQKVKQLQATHYYMNLPDSMRSMANRGHPSNAQQQQPRPGQAPPAQTFPAASSQQPTPQRGTPGAPNQIQFPQMQPPTIQEVQRFRASLPKANVMSDEQIRLTIMNRRRSGLMNANQNPQLSVVQNQQALQQQYANLLKAQQVEQTRSQGLPSGQIPQSQSGQTPGPQNGPQWAAQQARAQAEQMRRNQMSQAGIKPQQGLKRNNNDDIVEIPDPKLGQHQLRQPPTPGSMNQASAVTGQPAMVQEQFAALNRFSPAQLATMPPAQRAAFEAQRQNAMAQARQRGMITQQQQGTTSAQTQPQLMMGGDGSSSDAKILKIRQLREEVMRSMPPRKTVAMSPADRGAIAHKLFESKNQFVRVTKSLPVYLVATQNESRVKDVIRTVCNDMVW